MDDLSFSSQFDRVRQCGACGWLFHGSNRNHLRQWRMMKSAGSAQWRTVMMQGDGRRKPARYEMKSAAMEEFELAVVYIHNDFLPHNDAKIVGPDVVSFPVDLPLRGGGILLFKTFKGKMDLPDTMNNNCWTADGSGKIIIQQTFSRPPLDYRFCLGPWVGNRKKK
jgi:hypothetical protein